MNHTQAVHYLENIYKNEGKKEVKLAASILIEYIKKQNTQPETVLNINEGQVLHLIREFNKANQEFKIIYTESSNPEFIEFQLLYKEASSYKVTFFKLFRMYEKSRYNVEKFEEPNIIEGSAIVEELNSTLRSDEMQKLMSKLKTNSKS